MKLSGYGPYLGENQFSRSCERLKEDEYLPNLVRNVFENTQVSSEHFILF